MTRNLLYPYYTAPWTVVKNLSKKCPLAAETTKKLYTEAGIGGRPKKSDVEKKQDNLCNNNKADFAYFEEKRIKYYLIFNEPCMKKSNILRKKY